jgi:hypothetical protein
MRIRFVLLLGLISIISARVFPQSAKTLLIDQPLNDDPVRIVKVIEGTTEIKSDGVHYPNKWLWEGVVEKADEDWLTRLSLVIQNVSTKKIVYLNVVCTVTETANWQQEVATHSLTRNESPEPVLGQITNHVGLRPESALYSVRLKRRLQPGTGSAFELSPGQTYTIPFENPDYYPGLKSSVEERKRSMSSVNGCTGGIGQVFFEDGTQWQGHKYLRPDTDNPGHWIKMSVSEWADTK